MHFNYPAMICLVALVALGGCSDEGSTPVAAPSIQVGGLYATPDQDGGWRVMKVLAVDERAVHLRAYANRYRERPKDVDPATLTLGGDPAEFGIGHFPMAKEGFLKEKAVLIKVVPVTEDELEGYRMYLEG